ncbi:MAG TPA: ATPase, partial [Roseibacterium sp.]|nr:ATPase [Roseibacterium sp.]
MACTQNRSVIGVDGGGTNCRFAMLHQGRRVDFQSGSANASSDLDAALATLRQGLSGLAKAAGLALSDITDVPTFIGLAGVLDQDIATALSRNLPLTCIRIEDDRRPAMVGALGVSDGYVIGIGTGSFLGRRACGVDRLIGGWGLILGDEASGAYLGRQLLRRVLQVE